MPDSENIELPKLTSDEAWLDKDDKNIELSKENKRLFYLPYIAYKTAVYTHENELTHFQKDRLILLFRNEAEQAFNVVHNHVLLIVGNAPADRIEYLKDFESWKERLVTLLKKSIDCITKEEWIKEFTSSFPSKEQLAVEGKLTANGKLTFEGKEQFEEILQENCKRLKESVFDERIYLNKFSQFTIEAFHLLRRFSAMTSITMECSEWIIKGLENIGKLPEKVKIAIKKNNSPVKRNNLQAKVEKVVSECLNKPIEELNSAIKNLAISVETQSANDKPCEMNKPQAKDEQSNGMLNSPNKKSSGANNNFKSAGNINIQNFQGILGDVRSENLQTGDNTSIHKQEEIEKKKIGVVKILKIIAAIVAFLAALLGILSQIGLLE